MKKISNTQIFIEFYSIISMMNSIKFLLLIIALSFTTHSYGNGCQELLNDFLTTKNVASKELNLQNIAPRKTLLSFDENIADQVFQKAKTNFIESMDKELEVGNFETVIKKIKKEKIIDSMKESEEYYQNILVDMKAKRKRAATLRSIFIVFSTKHESPKNFEAFTKAFGKFNDTLDFKAFKSMPESAKKLEDTFDMKKITIELDNFKPAHSKSIIDQLRETKLSVLDLVEKKELSIEEFHEMRKLLKHYLNTIQLLIQFAEDKELTKSFNFLNELNDSLGSLRDENLKKEIEAINAGKKVKPSETETVPDDYKKNIRIFLDGIEFIY